MRWSTRTGIDPAAIDDVIVGCVSQVGEQSFHIGRNMVLASTLPDSVPAVTIDRQCGSSQQALHFAAQAVMSGTQDVVIAAGVESMTRVPMGTPVILPMQAGIGIGPWPQSIKDRYGVNQFSQFRGAEMMAQEIWLWPRASSTPSRSKATARPPPRRRRGAFEREIVPLDRSTASEPPHATKAFAPTRRSKAWPSLKTLVPDGVITAGNASQICDGASGVLVVNERALKEHGLTPLARIDQSDRHCRRSGDHARRADPRHARRAGTVGPQLERASTSTRSTRRSRRCRSPGCSRSTPTRRSSTSMAARSRSAIRSAQAARS